MDLEICINCYNYQHRLCWMLSSILQQEGDIPNILTSISYVENNGNPSTEEVIEFFREKGLNILGMPLTFDQIKNRSVSRNMRVKDTKADWILFADSDIVYDNHFFADIKSQLEKDPFKNEKKVIGANRYSLDISFCIEYFEKDCRTYPCNVENVIDIANKFPVKHFHGGGRAPGYFQLANVEAIMEKGGIYCGTKRDLWRRTKSDRGFRIQMGGVVEMKTKPMYHLNHDRGDENIQR